MPAPTMVVGAPCWIDLYSSDTDKASAFYGELLKRGVHAYGRYNVVIVTPPFTITREELREGLEAMDAALTALEKAL